MNNKAIRGMLTLGELKEKIESGEIETIVTVFSDLYGRMLGKRITETFYLNNGFVIKSIGRM